MPTASQSAGSAKGFGCRPAATYPAIPRACDEPDHDHRDARRADLERRGVAHQDRGRGQED
jgi:hypothetical protein